MAVEARAPCGDCSNDDDDDDDDNNNKVILMKITVFIFMTVFPEIF
jgi:hypothetical protein